MMSRLYKEHVIRGLLEDIQDFSKALALVSATGVDQYGEECTEKEATADLNIIITDAVSQLMEL